MIKLRLARHGAKHRPFYWLVAADAKAPRDGRYLEKLGTYNPMVPKDHQQRLQLNDERIRHYLKCGAQPSERVRLFLAHAGLVEPVARTERPIRSQPGAKMLERQKKKSANA